MGYRSNVQIICTENDFHALKGDALIKQIPFWNPDYIYELGWLKGEKMIHIVWTEVKWYLDYEDVRFIEEWMCSLRESDRPLAFVRIGESDNDIVIENDYENDIDFHVIRDVQVDFNFASSKEESTEE